jgi:catechol 2,3-dioxygenase-like lactoylglutathione lyase family enzyme
MKPERPLMTLCAVTLDCADAVALAAFYEAATGLVPAAGSGEDFAGLTFPDGFFLGFQPVPDYQAPKWPGQEQPQQAHLCFEVDDLDVAEAALLRLGAAKPQYQPNNEKYRVLADPAGHPFCLATTKSMRK